ncbi:MAG: hypothetical protein ACOYLX_22340 [Burkholderiaceae bacterium]
MSMYLADEIIRHRSVEIARTLRDVIVDDPAAGSFVDRAIAVLETMFDAELDLWASSGSDLDAETISTAGIELASTWVCLGMLRFVATTSALKAAVRESWPDKLEAWQEHGHAVAITMGQTTGDWATAIAYLKHYTEELLGRPA